MESVQLKGGGGAVFTFDLPLSPVYAEKVERGELVPADEESRELLLGAEEPAEEGEDVDDLTELSKEDLQGIAERLDLPVSGNKAEIAERIRQARSEGGSEEEPSEGAEEPAEEGEA